MMVPSARVPVGLSTLLNALRARIQLLQRCVEIAVEVHDRALEVSEGEMLVRSASHVSLHAFRKRAIFRGTGLGHEVRVSLRHLRSVWVIGGVRQGRSVRR